MTWITPLVGSYLLVVGLMLGSFINLAADRLPRGESIVYPGSHCRACGRHLNAIDLLPLIGYALRRGRCATCGVSIGATSPAIEATSGACMAVPLVWLGLWPGAAAGLALVVLWGCLVTGIAQRRPRSAETAK